MFYFVELKLRTKKCYDDFNLMILLLFFEILYELEKSLNINV